MLTAATLKGVWATALLPLADDDRIDLDRLRAQVATLARSGVDGVYAHGTAGEFHTLTEDEFWTVAEIVAQECRAAGSPFQIGASHSGAQTCRTRTARARELAPDAIQVTLPDWLPLSADEVRRFLTGIAEAAGPVPLVLYNPPHAKTLLTLPEHAALAAAVPSLIGIKVAGGGPDWYAGIRAHCASLAVFVPGHQLATGVRAGAAGSYSNVAALQPTGAARWWTLMHSDPAAADAVQDQILSFFADHVEPLQQQGFGSPALDKFLACLGGWADVGTRVRWPAASVPPGHAEALRAEVRTRIPLLFGAPGQ